MKERYKTKLFDCLIKVCTARAKEQPKNKTLINIASVLKLHRPQSLLHLCLNLLNSKAEYREKALVTDAIPEELKARLQSHP